MRYELRQGGSFIRTDELGLLVNDAQLANVQAEYKMAVPRVIDSYRRVFADKIHSIYIRGSVARGNAIPGFSDYDCVALLSDAPDVDDRSRIKGLARELRGEFPYVSQFDLSFFQLADLLSNEEFKAWQFAIKIQSLCVAGNDISPQLPNYRPSPEIAYSLFHLEKRIEKFTERITLAFHPDATRYWCSWIMRTFVRCGLELVLCKEGAYTNELPLCAAVFAEHYPAMTDQMHRALELAVNPSTNMEEIFGVAQSVGGWLVKERVTVYGR